MSCHSAGPFYSLELSALAFSWRTGLDDAAAGPADKGACIHSSFNESLVVRFAQNTKTNFSDITEVSDRIIIIQIFPLRNFHWTGAHIHTRCKRNFEY